MRYFGSSADQKDAIAREYIDEKLAPVETSPATAAHTAGDLLIYNGTLYRATADIPVGATLTVGTNIAATDLDEVASLLKSAINDKASIDLGITGAAVGQVAAVSAVDGNGKPTAWDAISAEYELIEKIIVGYSVLLSKPADWESNWTSYYENVGTLRNPEYQHLTSASAPEWAAATYYSYSDEGVWEVFRNKEPDGTDYSFADIVACFRIMSSTKADSYLFAYINAYDNATNAVRTIYSAGGNIAGSMFVWGAKNIDNIISFAYGAFNAYWWSPKTMNANPSWSSHTTGMPNTSGIGIKAYNQSYSNIASGNIMWIYAKR